MTTDRLLGVCGGSESKTILSATLLVNRLLKDGHELSSLRDPELRRAFRYLTPYWRRLSLVFAISLISTATTLAVPYLTKDLIDRRAHRPRPRGAAASRA